MPVGCSGSQVQGYPRSRNEREFVEKCPVDTVRADHASSREVASSIDGFSKALA